MTNNPLHSINTPYLTPEEHKSWAPSNRSWGGVLNFIRWTQYLWVHSMQPEIFRKSRSHLTNADAKGWHETSSIL